MRGVFALCFLFATVLLAQNRTATNKKENGRYQYGYVKVERFADQNGQVYNEYINLYDRYDDKERDEKIKYGTKFDWETPNSTFQTNHASESNTAPLWPQSAVIELRNIRKNASGNYIFGSNPMTVNSFEGYVSMSFLGAMQKATYIRNGQIYQYSESTIHGRMLSIEYKDANGNTIGRKTQYLP